MDGTEEPILEQSSGSEEREDLAERILRLVSREPFAVLCTEGQAQPYGSVVAVAFTDDLRHALFATPITTRKFRLLSANDRVALVVDDRSVWADDMMRIEAVTLTGRAHLVERGPQFPRWSGLLLRRHPQLESFVRSESSALFRIDVLRYLHVERFQEVSEWIPPSS